jgi:BMFP domain-containing protein YqiC
MNFFEEVFFMKKSIASALTMAVVLGAASTTFAAPADDEVAALKARVADLERVVREQNERIIREQKNSNANTRREVENLDYRLTELENADNDSWTDKFNLTGELRYRLWSRHENADVSQLQMRLFPTFNIDEHLAVKSRITGTYRLNDDTRARGNDIEMNFAYLEAKYDNFKVNAGKMPLFTNADQGLLIDDFFSGLQVTTGENVKITVNGGNFKGNNYIGAEATTKINDKFDAGLGYHYVKTNGSDNKASIITGGVGFNVNEDWKVFGAFAHNTKANSDKTAYNVEGSYKGANKNEKSSWGAYAAYRYVPYSVTSYSTYDTFGQDGGKKGFELGATWTPYQNTLTKLAYFHGKYFGGGDDRTLFARASIFF